MHVLPRCTMRIQTNICKSPGGVKTNIINRLVSGSTWLTLREVRNRFYLRGTGLQNLKVTIVHTNAHLGV